MDNIIIKDLENVVKNRMSEKRFIHTLGVVEKSKELAIKNNANVRSCEIAAYLHDICKEIDKSTLKKIVKENFPNEITEKDLETHEILHGFAGFVTAKNEFHITDYDILDAIKYHTIGKAGLCLTGRIVYIADMIEKNRSFPGVEEIRKKVNEDMDQGIVFAIDEIIKFLSEKNAYIHPNTMQMRNWLIERRKNGF